ncbi:unnamed protein product [Hyaloperonospora brassicae]|uniref:Glycoside hydrolase family 5 domain-containing protein n=1 Tax=Hyaloperonospora brassicae TaxID=162125 RepID=A0AAV0US40_HYABA|nr:unnamed protein product [Hyaloperonospora brassicae]
MYTGNSPIGENAGERTNSNVWRDTSEAEMYGSYLGPGINDTNSEVPMMRPTMAARPSTSVHQDIAVGQLDDPGLATGTGPAKAYSGRKVVWPGALFLFLAAAVALSLITYFGIQEYTAAQTQQSLTESVSDVARARRRKSTSVKSCMLPDYIAEDGKIYARNSFTGKQEPLVFTGINWSGMENAEGVPHGLAAKQSYLDDIAKNLSDSGFNAVRLPLNAQMIVDNAAPNTKLFVNALDTDLNVVTYIDMIKKVVQGLGKQQIGVLLDIHKIDPNFTDDTSEHLWFTDDYPIATIYEMFETLAAELCSDLEYNIVGIDLKNEPVGGCWPKDDSDKYCDPDVNWPRAVETIGNKILAICPNWLIVAEGNYAIDTTSEINGVNLTYNDWYGASMQNASVNPIVLAMEKKLVFAPHFYSPSVYPSSYYFLKQSSSGSTVSVTEFPDTAEGTKLLEGAVTAVLDNAFGNVVTETGIPTFYGEFGGIYGTKELLKGRTSTRTIDILIEYANKMNMTGGFVWGLNPDGAYDFNDKFLPDDPWQYGLYTDSTWEKFHTDYATSLQSLKGSGPFPCFMKTTIKTFSTSGSGSDTITVDSITDAPVAGTPTTGTATAPAAVGEPPSATAVVPAAPATPAAPAPPAAPGAAMTTTATASLDATATAL